MIKVCLMKAQVVWQNHHKRTFAQTQKVTKPNRYRTKFNSKVDFTWCIRISSFIDLFQQRLLLCHLHSSDSDLPISAYDSHATGNTYYSYNSDLSASSLSIACEIKVGTISSTGTSRLKRSSRKRSTSITRWTFVRNSVDKVDFMSLCTVCTPCTSSWNHCRAAVKCYFAYFPAGASSVRFFFVASCPQAALSSSPRVVLMKHLIPLEVNRSWKAQTCSIFGFRNFW